MSSNRNPKSFDQNDPYGGKPVEGFSAIDTENRSNAGPQTTRFNIAEIQDSNLAKYIQAKKNTNEKNMFSKSYTNNQDDKAIIRHQMNLTSKKNFLFRNQKYDPAYSTKFTKLPKFPSTFQGVKLPANFKINGKDFCDYYKKVYELQGYQYFKIPIERFESLYPGLSLDTRGEVQVLKDGRQGSLKESRKAADKFQILDVIGEFVHVCYNKWGKSKAIFDKTKFTHWRDDIWVDPVTEPDVVPEEVPEFDPQSAIKETPMKKSLDDESHSSNGSPNYKKDKKRKCKEKNKKPKEPPYKSYWLECIDMITRKLDMAFATEDKSRKKTAPRAGRKHSVFFKPTLVAIEHSPGYYESFSWYDKDLSNKNFEKVRADEDLPTEFPGTLFEMTKMCQNLEKDLAQFRKNSELDLGLNVVRKG